MATVSLIDSLSSSKLTDSLPGQQSPTCTHIPLLRLRLVSDSAQILYAYRSKMSQWPADGDYISDMAIKSVASNHLGLSMLLKLEFFFFLPHLLRVQHFGYGTPSYEWKVLILYHKNRALWWWVAGQDEAAALALGLCACVSFRAGKVERKWENKTESEWQQEKHRGGLISLIMTSVDYSKPPRWNVLPLSFQHHMAAFKLPCERSQLSNSHLVFFLPHFLLPPVKFCH